MFGLGMPELIVILLVALLLFGAKRLPDIGRSLGRAISAFKQGVKDGEDESHGDKPPSSGGSGV
jgi:sec-independent protein translocase protein TatA